MSGGRGTVNKANVSQDILWDGDLNGPGDQQPSPFLVGVGVRRGGGKRGPAPQAVSRSVILPPRHKITGLHKAGLKPRATTSWSWPDLVVTATPQAGPKQPPGVSQSTTNNTLNREGPRPSHQLIPPHRSRVPGPAAFSVFLCSATNAQSGLRCPQKLKVCQESPVTPFILSWTL